MAVSRLHLLALPALLCSGAALAQTAQPNTLDAQMQQQQRRAPSTSQASPAQAAPAQWPTMQGQQKPAAQPAQPQAAPAPAMMAPAPQQSWPAAAPQPAGVPQAPLSYGIESTGGGAIPALPLEIMTTQSGVRFVSGGIGDEEMQQLKMIAPEYNLQVMLSAGKGEYISGVTLRVLDEKGAQILTVQEAGPYFYARLPAGIYYVETSVTGESVVKKIKLRVDEGKTTKEHIVYNQ